MGPWVHVAGTTATDQSGAVVGIGDAQAQTRQALKNIENALSRAGAALSDVVRTRIYVVDMSARLQTFDAEMAMPAGPG